MIPLPRSSALLIALLLLAPAARAADQIAWSPSLKAGLAEAKKQQKILMVCINAKTVKGEKEEPAAKGLREVVYKDERVVEKSLQFVCAMVTPESGSVAHGLLRNLGIGGEIVSPQHIFISPDGKRILLRREYWSHGQGDAAVRALLDLMEEAKRRLAEPVPPAEKEKKPTSEMGKPGTGDERAEWIKKMIDQVVNAEWEDRDAALRALVKNDKDGDCIEPLVALFDEQKKNTTLIVDLVRALGRDGLTAAALPIAELLHHREDAVRGNAAVSLEYIGSREKKVVTALKKAASKEKDEMIANHMCRALGRCGVEDASARALLLQKSEQSKTEAGSYGPIIGLSYFVGDKKAIRGVEKILKRVGIPGGRRGGGQNAIKRGVLSWTLGQIGDKRSAKFVREELIDPLDNMKAWWVQGVRGFYESLAKKCEGDDASMAAIEAGVRRIVQFASGRFPGGGGGAPGGGGGRGGRGRGGGGGTGVQTLMDEYRKGREAGKFTPKGDYLLGAGNE